MVYLVEKWQRVVRVAINVQLLSGGFWLNAVQSHITDIQQNSILLLSWISINTLKIACHNPLLYIALSIGIKSHSLEWFYMVLHVVMSRRHYMTLHCIASEGTAGKLYIYSNTHHSLPFLGQVYHLLSKLKAHPSKFLSWCWRKVARVALKLAALLHICSGATAARYSWQNVAALPLPLLKM